MSKDRDLIERMNKKMLGADNSRYSESEVKDINKNTLKDISEINSQKIMKDVQRFMDEYKNRTYSLNMKENTYVATDTADGKDYTGTYIYQFPPRDRDEFRLLYAKVNEVRLRMEKVMTSNNDVDYAYELKHYKEWLEQIVK